MKLNEYLKKYKITISEFSRRINYGKGNISRIIKGEITPSLKTALKIEQATNGEVPVQKLAKGE